MSLQNLFFSQKNLESVFNSLVSYIKEKKEFQIQIPNFNKQFEKIAQMTYESLPELRERKDLVKINEQTINNFLNFIKNYKQYMKKQGKQKINPQKSYQDQAQKLLEEIYGPESSQDTLSQSSSSSSNNRSIDSFGFPVNINDNRNHNIVSLKEDTDKSLEVPKKELKKIKKKFILPIKNVKLPLKNVISVSVQKIFLTSFSLISSQNNTLEFYIQEQKEDINTEKRYSVTIPSSFYIQTLEKANNMRNEILYLIKEEIQKQIPEFRISLDRYTQKIRFELLKKESWKPNWGPLWDLLGFKNIEYQYSNLFISHKNFKFCNCLFYLSCSFLNDLYDEDQNLFCISIFERQLEPKKISFKEPQDIDIWDWSLSTGKKNRILEFEDGKEPQIVLEIEMLL